MSLPLLVVVGARPNFVKVAPVWHALAEIGVAQRLLHTGQHYDHALSGSFLEQLALPEPDVSLGVGPGTHAVQTGAALVGVERVLMERPHSGVLVAGDVNSTLAAALAAAKLGVPVIPPRGRPALGGLDDARGDQPRPVRSLVGLAAVSDSGRGRNALRRGHRARPRRAGRQHDDRHVVPVGRPRARRRGTSPGRAAERTFVQVLEND
jgi:hypothetical protein